VVGNRGSASTSEEEAEHRGDSKKMDGEGEAGSEVKIKVTKANNLDKAKKGRLLSRREQMTAKKLLNVRDMARALGVHENTIRNWESRGVLRVVRLPGGGYRRFRAEDVERMSAEMLEQLAPAIEGPVTNADRKRTGRLASGVDDTQSAQRGVSR
jgi:excisionase family DNA binding protein